MQESLGKFTTRGACWDILGDCYSITLGVLNKLKRFKSVILLAENPPDCVLNCVSFIIFPPLEYAIDFSSEATLLCFQREERKGPNYYQSMDQYVIWFYLGKL